MEARGLIANPLQREERERAKIGTREKSQSGKGPVERETVG